MKALVIALMLALPLIAVWLASSLAAFGNRAAWEPAVAGLLLFPGLPLLWEGAATLRRHGDRVARAKRRVLTFADRLALRTVLVSSVFLVVLLAAFPSRAFVALSTRGDWMLDRRHGPNAERLRGALLASAGGLEWLYRASHDNPYRHGREGEGTGIDPRPSEPSAAPSASAAPTASASAAPVGTDAPGSAAEKAPRDVVYPMAATLSPVIVNMPPEAEVSIQSVGAYIANHESDPVLRVKALHDWVADRIAYDTPAYRAHSVPWTDGEAQSVFRTRIGVCAGYARLLAELGKVTGDEIVYLTGDARSQEAPMEGEGHAWNAVKLRGHWYLIDATWDAGPSDTTFHKKYGTEYLFAPPEQFAVSHFPDADKWQLLDHPLSRAEFFRRPVVGPAFFANGLAFRTPDRSQVAVGGSLDVVLDNPRNVFLLADYRPKHGGATAAVECKTKDEHGLLHCDFPTEGTYDVHLFANAQRYGSYGYVGSLEVNARR